MDVEPEIVIEEGEITDDSDNDYTPLERPKDYSVTVPNPKFQHKVTNSTDEENVSTVSDSGSDSDNCQAKKPKLKLRPKLIPKPRHKKRYDIWSTRVQEDVLAETMISCDVSRIDRSRDVETYDYTLGRKLHEPRQMGVKRTRADRNNSKLRVGTRQMSEDRDLKGAPRDIMDLAVKIDAGIDEMARDIANKLFEEKDELIKKILTIAGLDRTLEHFKETQRIEKDGGMLIMNQTRRRTPGGVFFFLVKRDDKLSRDQIELIFNEDKQKTSRERKANHRQKNKRGKNGSGVGTGSTDAAIKLPDLLTHAELCVQQLSGGGAARKHHVRSERKESDEHAAVVPPPSPVTDGGKDNSSDGMNDVNVMNVAEEEAADPRLINSYEEDYLDVGCGNDMDLF